MTGPSKTPSARRTSVDARANIDDEIEHEPEAHREVPVQRVVDGVRVGLHRQLSEPEEDREADRVAELARIGRRLMRKQLGLIVLLVIAALAPLYLPAYELSLLGRFLAMAILALGISLIWGTGGTSPLGPNA